MTSNPFRYGAPVEDAGFCDRTGELAVLTERMASGVHAFLLAPRRYGKTSLVLRAIDALRGQGGRAAYVNLLLCTTEDEVASVILTAVVREALRPGGRVRRSLEDLVRGIRVSPRAGIQPNGSVSLAFEPGTRDPGMWLDVLVDAVEALESVAGEHGAALVLDEFQAIADIGPRGLGGVFKALADHTRHSSLVFSGSHLSVMENLTRSPGAPLLGMGETVRLMAIPPGPMVDHLVSRATTAGKHLDADVAELIYRTGGPIPNDVQWLAHASFEASGHATDITGGDVAVGLGAIIERQAGAFAERYEALAPVQQRIVRALAQGPVEQVFAKAFLDVTRVANANAVRTALRVLSAAEVVARDDGGWGHTNPFFARWLEGHDA